jgi:hypothetical protein
MLIDENEVRMGELQSAVEPRHFPGEDSSGTGLQLTLPVTDQPRLSEESADNLASMVGDGRLESRLAPDPNVRAVIKIEGTGVHHLREYRNLFIFSK